MKIKLKTQMKKIAVINLIVVFFFLSFGYVEAQMCTTKPLSQFPTSPVNGQAANNLMNGVKVTRSYSGPPKVYSGDTNPYCSGSPYADYTIILPASGYSSKVTYTFSKPITNAEIWLMVMGSPATEKDKVKLSTNNGTPTFSIVYDCAKGKGSPAATLSSGVVTSHPHIVTDVAVRVNSSTPFTQLIVEDINGTESSGVLVELCPSSITPAETISITTQPQNQTICDNATAIFTSKAQLKDATGNIKYKWQQSSNGTTWTDIPSFAGTIASGGTTTLTIAGTTNYKYRVEYSYQFAAGIVVTATSTAAEIDIRDKIEVTEFKASPATIQLGVPTNVQFTIKGTVGADVTYNINGTNTQTVNLGASGIYTFNRTLSQTTDITITKIKKICEVTTPMRLRVGGDGAACTGMPPSLFAASDNATVVLNGITVTRSFANGVVKVLGGSLYSIDPQCPAYWFANNALVGDIQGTPKLTYKFSKPITSAQIWLSAFGMEGVKVDKAKFTVNCGATSQISVTDDCRNNTSFTLQSQNTVIAAGMLPTDNTNIAVVVTADKPFTEITVDALDSKGGGI